MQPQESFEILKTHFENNNSITINIFAYSAEIYSKLNHNSASNSNEVKNPRVFISYTGNDPDNRTWVKNLANKLRKNGVDARLDMFHLKVGQELPQWMTNELMMADNYAKNVGLPRGIKKPVSKIYVIKRVSPSAHSTRFTPQRRIYFPKPSRASKSGWPRKSLPLTGTGRQRRALPSP